MGLPYRNTLSLLYFFLQFYTLISGQVVTIDQGEVRGQNSEDGNYAMYLGVPYAKVNEANPFSTATASPAFTSKVFEANNGDIKCPQAFLSIYSPKSTDENEIIDCLRLNIYVPNTASSTNQLPVFVWIHGGGYHSGSMGQYDPAYFLEHDVIVVTMNYRLGAYGFMCLNDSSVPGNQGLKDQYMALQWISENIGAFGGDVSKITIGGQSAGAASVIMQIYTKKDKLFNQAIIQSGTPLADGMFELGDYDAATKMATYLGSDASDTRSALEFLSQSSIDDIYTAIVALGLRFRPCTEITFLEENTFINVNPFSFFNEEKIRNMPIIIGVTSSEREGLLEGIYGENYYNVNPFYEKLSLNFDFDEETLVKAANFVRRFYLADGEISRDNLNIFEEFDGDFVYMNPVHKSITMLLEEGSNPLYSYVYNYTNNQNKNGPSHGEELRYLFKGYRGNVLSSEADILISNRLITMWMNFVKYGNPTPSVTSLLPTTWEPITETSTRPYMLIDTNMEMGSRVYYSRMAFWELFYKAYSDYHKLNIEVPHGEVTPENNAFAIRTSLLSFCVVMFSSMFVHLLVQ